MEFVSLLGSVFNKKITLQQKLFRTKKMFPPKKTKYVYVGQTIVRFSIRVVRSSFEVEG